MPRRGRSSTGEWFVHEASSGHQRSKLQNTLDYISVPCWTNYGRAARAELGSEASSSTHPSVDKRLPGNSYARANRLTMSRLIRMLPRWRITSRSPSPSDGCGDPGEGALHHPPTRQDLKTPRRYQPLPVNLLALLGPLLRPDLGYLLGDRLFGLAHHLHAQAQDLLGPPPASTLVSGVYPQMLQA
jgi:hypothetical protein